MCSGNETRYRELAQLDWEVDLGPPDGVLMQCLAPFDKATSDEVSQISLQQPEPIIACPRR